MAIEKAKEQSVSQDDIKLWKKTVEDYKQSISDAEEELEVMRELTEAANKNPDVIESKASFKFELDPEYIAVQCKQRLIGLKKAERETEFFRLTQMQKVVDLEQAIAKGEKK